MKIIKQLVEMIEDELEGAEEYAKCAIKHKADHPMLARALYDISVQEMVHVLTVRIVLCAIRRACLQDAFLNLLRQSNFGRM